MKFTDGYWQMRPGVTAHFPVHEVEVDDEARVVYGPTRRLNHRKENIPSATSSAATASAITRGLSCWGG